MESAAMAKGFTHESTNNETVEWYTPKWVFDAIGLEYDLDPCSPGAHKTVVPAKKHLTVVEDGLATPWDKKDLVWMNPPYGLGIYKWMDKLAEHGNGVALIFARMDTSWAQNNLPTASAICFLSGRVRFINGNTGEPGGTPGAGSMLVAYGETAGKAVRNCGLGMVFTPDTAANATLMAQREADKAAKTAKAVQKDAVTATLFDITD
jgi:phage N-6-adenine-methyltransferase